MSNNVIIVIVTVFVVLVVLGYVTISTR